MPAGLGVVEFCRGIVDAVPRHAVAVKPQAAFFEAQGADGWAALTEVCEYAREAGLLVIADAKRGDVPSTARAYAPRSRRSPTRSPSIPTWASTRSSRSSPTTGSASSSSSRPRIRAASTSRIFRSPTDVLLWQHVAGLVDRWGADFVGESGLSSVGAVVGATFPQEVAEVRQLLPRSVLLLPGVGAQGARAEDLGEAFAIGPAGALVSASRSVLYADRGAGWQEAAAAEAERLAGELRCRRRPGLTRGPDPHRALGCTCGLSRCHHDRRSRRPRGPRAGHSITRARRPRRSP